MIFFQELRHRKVFKVATVYIVTGWLLMQVGSLVMPTFDAPTWVMKAFIVLMAFGFILTLILAWSFEAAPEGLKRESDIPLEESITKAKIKKTSMLSEGNTA
ncbi:MAG: hypothetical protein ACI88A_001866 [Paraglaciecola sp.]|jgi:hypothetical protein